MVNHCHTKSYPSVHHQRIIICQLFVAYVLYDSWGYLSSVNTLIVSWLAAAPTAVALGAPIPRCLSTAQPPGCGPGWGAVRPAMVSRWFKGFKDEIMDGINPPA